MVTIIIPGYSAYNRQWVESVASGVRSDGEIRPIYWGHWDDPSIKFDPKEKAHLLDSVSGKRVVDIIAKSLGTLVAAYLIEKSPEKIRKVILNGICLNDIGEEEKEVIKNALKKIPKENILILQNDEDPHGTYDMVKNFLSEFGNDIKIISKHRADHEYFYQDDFDGFLLG